MPAFAGPPTRPIGVGGPDGREDGGKPPETISVMSNPQCLDAVTLSHSAKA